MCSPTHYSVAYSINPWMDLTNDVDWRKARKQWQDLHHLIIRLGGYVELIDPQPGLPDMVFTANAGFILPKYRNVVVPEIIPSRFEHEERSGEEEYFNFWFKQHGFGLFKTPSLPFEGAGDMLFDESNVFLGHGFRTDQDALDGVISWINQFPKHTPHKCHLVDPRFYHLDTCFCPLGKNRYMVYDSAFADFDRWSQNVGGGAHWIHVPEEEAEKFACNAVVIGDSIILPRGCPWATHALQDYGFEVYETPMSEFIKAGGACKCLTLKLGDSTVS